MRPLWKDILIAIWLGMILPGIVLNAFVLKEKDQEGSQVQQQELQLVRDSERTISLTGPDGICIPMGLDDYLVGVLLAEMPAEFQEEALKAQAVAARTYAWKSCTTGRKHGNGSVCGESSCCQAFLSEEDYLQRGGLADSLEKVRNAVQSTCDMVLVYAGELIEATYFSSSGGKTESALAVWGADYPYLQSVSSPETTCSVTTSFTLEEFQNLLGHELSDHPEKWIGPISYTDGGGVASLEICGESYTGVAMRSLLGLRSTAFEIQTDGNRMIVTTQGYGHRVGMSQYGADAMAESGSTWQEILQHYYPGAILCPLP